MKITIVLPTYNEAENLPLIVEELGKVMETLECEWEIIVVDDNSPDGTAEVAKKLASKYPVRVVVRQGRMGLTSAIHTGMKNAQGDLIIVMDADLQHPPSTIPSLVQKSSECDIVIASRYVKGGKTIGFPFFRRLTSHGAIILTRMLIGKARKVKDPVSGFFLVKKNAVENWEPVEPFGYKALTEILAASGEARVCEVPFEFKARMKGSSKLSFKIILAHVKTLLKLNPLGFTLLTLGGVSLLVILLYAIRLLIS
ncbi:polyprenol monophosphomannose synthase [Thermosphaera chiliense]|uniref:Polyprenol monophosphomannose synthase n=2 Tax=Thermosphaera chiliense TaxID=3402707 RepID=A0A7M1USF9_9CREN|nr:polyprenol monophosphomannose synthase [Thermosphaera aggregans]